MKEYILISQSSYNQSRINIKSENKMFLNDLIMKISENCITFEVPTLDYRGKTVKMSRKCKSYFQNSCTKIEKEGKFYLEQEDERLIVRL